jgi:hypothetical protein
MTEKTNEAARIDRLFLIPFILAFAFFAVSMYVRFTTEEDPLWAELAGPLLFALLGLRSVLRPSPPETRKASRAVGFLLLFASGLLAALVIQNSLGAN